MLSLFAVGRPGQEEFKQRDGTWFATQGSEGGGLQVLYSYVSQSLKLNNETEGIGRRKRAVSKQSKARKYGGQRR